VVILKIFASVELYRSGCRPFRRLGAIGIARMFNYGGFKNRALYDPNIVEVKMTKEEYKRVIRQRLIIL
jgi:HD superfamily phosphodiesterase